MSVCLSMVASFQCVGVLHIAMISEAVLFDTVSLAPFELCDLPNDALKASHIKVQIIRPVSFDTYG